MRPERSIHAIYADRATLAAGGRAGASASLAARSGRGLKGLILLACLLAFPVGAALPEVPGLAGPLVLPDLSMADQEGRPVKFASEAVGREVVAINFVYTTCTTSCPLNSATFKRVQTQLKGRDVKLITLTLDPERDTPERLKAYAERYKAGPGWTWLTGQPEDVKRVLQALGAYTADIRQHPAQLLVGDGRRGVWTRFNTLPGPDRIVSTLDHYLKGHGHD